MLKDKEYERDDLFIEMQLCIKKLNYMQRLSEGDKSGAKPEASSDSKRAKYIA